MLDGKKEFPEYSGRNQIMKRLIKTQYLYCQQMHSKCEHLWIPSHSRRGNGRKTGSLKDDIEKEFF